jgi:hypothetical protein
MKILCGTFLTLGARRFFLPLVFIVNSTAGCGSHYEWKAGDERYWVAESGRIVQLIEVAVRETSSPFKPWGHVLVEPCAADEQVAASQNMKLPCWPTRGLPPAQELLATLYWKMPGYRGKPGLLLSSEKLNRDIGTFRQAWIIGTAPLAVAFLKDGPVEIPRLARKLEARARSQTTSPTTGPDAPPKNIKAKTWRQIAPGLFEMGWGSETVRTDLRQRHARLVREADLDVWADVVLLFPLEMHVSAGLPDPPPDLRVKVVHLDKPETLRTLMEALTKSDKLARDAEQVEEVPVSLFPPPDAEATDPAAN